MAISFSELERPSEEQRSSSRRYSISFLREIPERGRKRSRWPKRACSFGGTSIDYLADVIPQLKQQSFDNDDTLRRSSKLSTHHAFYACISAKNANFEAKLASFTQGSDHLSVKPPMCHSEREQACAPLPQSACTENQSRSPGGASSNDYVVDVTPQLKQQVPENGQILELSNKRSTHHALFACMPAKEADVEKNLAFLAPGSAHTDRPGMKPPPVYSEPERACAPLPSGKVSSVSDDPEAMRSSSSPEPQQFQSERSWHDAMKRLRTSVRRKFRSCSRVRPM